ncbi:MAG: hypothetical protein RDU20_13250 [Desulfomonilaceae bacterium]|nr:hypothetical protein [Desulfomonilaceae bacterium]
MRRRPRTVLVCLVFLYIAFPLIAVSADRDALHVIVNPTPQHAATAPPIVARQGLFDTTRDEAMFQTAAYAPPLHSRGTSFYPNKPVTKCKTAMCPVVPVPTGPSCTLPQRRWRQWELSAQTFYARVRGKLSWVDPWSGFVHPDLDFNDGMGLPGHEWLMEYSARYQFRPHWSCFYSIMPFEMNERFQNPNFPGIVFHTKWEHVYQRVGIMYQPIVTCNASVSIYNTWLFMDQKFSLNSGSHCARNSTIRVDRTRHMIMSGIELQKCVRTLCNGGTLSCDARVGLGYLDDTFGLDVQAGFRFSVPMNCGRWGYARGGYRLVEFKEDRNDLRMDHSLEGWFAELGLIF